VIEPQLITLKGRYYYTQDCDRIMIGSLKTHLKVWERLSHLMKLEC